jgi:hypothetical protein
MMNVIGHSSSVYEWDATSEKFRQSKPYADHVPVAYGFSEKLSGECVFFLFRMAKGSRLKASSNFI